MRDLIQSLRELRPKLERFRTRPLKEMPTRAIFIDPILEALGWDVRDPDAVELEYPTVDRKVVDYALKLDHRPVLLVEAKPLSDRLTDFKSVAQVIGYAANAGVIWCILTNGARWRVYRRLDGCPVPERPVFEVSIDPWDTDRVTLPQIAEQMWCFSREECAKGNLAAIGEQVLLADRVRQGLDGLMRQPSRRLLNLVCASIGDRDLKPRHIKDSLALVWSDLGSADSPESGPRVATRGGLPRPRHSNCAAGECRDLRQRHRHPAGVPRAVVRLYRAIDRLCLTAVPGTTTKRHFDDYVAYSYQGHDFCWVCLGPRVVSVALRLRPDRRRHRSVPTLRAEQPGLWRDVVVVTVNKPSQLEVTARLIQRAFDSLAGRQTVSR
jgi:hypothetical protein